MSKINTDRIGTRDGTLDIDVKSIMVRSDAMENLGDYEQGIELAHAHEFIVRGDSWYTAKTGQVPYVLTGVWEYDKERLEIYGAWDHSSLKNRNKEGSHSAGAIAYDHGSDFPDKSLGKELQTLKNNSSDYQIVDSFEQGATITERNQALQVEADGRLYRWAGDLPKTVAAGSSPETTGGAQVGAWLEVSDLTLRQDLANPDKGTSEVAYRQGISLRHKVVDLITASDLTDDIAGVTAVDLGHKRVLVLDGHKTYGADIFHRQNNSTVIGNGATVNVGGGSSPTMVRIGNNATIDGVKFQSTELDKNNSRGSMELTEGAKYSNCIFRGFRSPTARNGWGLYLKNTKNATITNVKFSDNTTYDLTLVDTVENTTISGVNSEDGNGCVMVIEPNAVELGAVVKNTRIFGSKFSLLGIMENATPHIYTYGTTIDGCQIDSLLLQGGVRTRLLNSTFNTISSGDGYLAGMMCDLESDSIWLGPELLADPSLSTLGVTGSPWSTYSAGTNMFSRTKSHIRIYGESVSGYANGASFSTSLNNLSEGIYCLKINITAELDIRDPAAGTSVNVSIDGVSRSYQVKLFGRGEYGVRSGVRTLFFTLTKESAVRVAVSRSEGYYTNVDVRGISVRRLEDHGLPFNEVPLLFNTGDYTFATLPTLATVGGWRERVMDGTRFKSTDPDVDSYVFRGNAAKEIRYYSPPTP